MLESSWYSTTIDISSELNWSKTNKNWLFSPILSWFDLAVTEMTLSWPWCDTPVKSNPNPWHHVYLGWVSLNVFEVLVIGPNMTTHPAEPAAERLTLIIFMQFVSFFYKLFSTYWSTRYIAFVAVLNEWCSWILMGNRWINTSNTVAVIHITITVKWWTASHQTIWYRRWPSIGPAQDACKPTQ